MSYISTLFLLISACLLPFPTQAAATMKLYSAEKLKTKIAEPELVVVDCRNAYAYRKGHIKGAIHLDSGCSGPLVHKLGKVPCTLKSPGELLSLLTQKGLCPDQDIIVYGDHNSWGAEGRLLWLLQKLGYSKIALLNGGYDHWQQLSEPTAALFADHKEPCQEQLMQNLTVSTLEKAKIGADALWQLYRQGNLIFLDVRSQAEYDGEILYREERGGHLPDALHFDWKDFWNDDYTLKTKAELQARLTHAGLPLPEQTGEKLIVTYCTGGIRSGYAWFVLDWLGYPQVENYDNGFWEWAASPNLPLQHQ